MIVISLASVLSCFSEVFGCAFRLCVVGLLPAHKVRAKVRLFCLMYNGEEMKNVRASSIIPLEYMLCSRISCMRRCGLQAQRFVSANSMSHSGKLNTPNEPAHNPSGASPQPLGSLLTEGCEQAGCLPCQNGMQSWGVETGFYAEVVIKFIAVQ